MVSFDAPEKNAEFAKSLKANLVLLSDTKGDVASAFDVSNLGGMYAKRWTFYVDKDGRGPLRRQEREHRHVRARTSRRSSRS